MAGTSRLDITLHGIGEFLGANIIAVPRYQRSYAWTTSEVTDLLTDLTDVLDRQEEEYFLGSVVSIGADTNSVDVVDGQQRLTTVTMIVASIRDRLLAIGDEDRASELERDFLFNRDRRSRSLTPRLKLNDADNEFFQRMVLNRPDERTSPVPSGVRAAQTRIMNAQQIIQNHFDEATSGFRDATSVLLDWIDLIETRAKIISVKVPDDANAFLIFETLNDRGLALAVTDLIKNYLFSVSDERISEVQQRWSNGVDYLESLSIDDVVLSFIRHFWSSRKGITRKDELLTSIKRSVKLPSQAVEFADQFVASSYMYGAIAGPDASYWSRYPDASLANMNILNMLRMIQIRPLLLAVLERFEPAEVDKVMKLAVSWSVRFLTVGGSGAGVIEAAYADRAKLVFEGALANSRDLASSMKTIVPSNVQFVSAFSQVSVSTQKVARYYLRVLDEIACGNKNPPLTINTDTAAVNLEHVMPKKLGDGWIDINDDVHKAYLNRLGNLALMETKKNAAAQNAPFSSKRLSYEEAPFKLTRSIASLEEWTPESIDQRQERLAKLALEAWSID